MTDVCPISKLVPDVGSQVIETSPELSAASGSSHVTIAVGFPSSISVDWPSTQVSVGISVSIKTTTIVV